MKAPDLFVARVPAEPETPWAEVRVSAPQTLSLMLALNAQMIDILETTERLSRRWAVIATLWAILSLVWVIQAALHLAAALL